MELSGPAHMDRYLLETGIPALDAAVGRWPGVALLFCSEVRARTVLASQIAFETTRTGNAVLWCCAGGHHELALLMMMTRLANLELRRVFVKRDLRQAEWRRLERAAAAVSKLPLRFADVHGAGAAELEDAFYRSVADSHAEYQLVVIDNLDAPPKPTLAHLEHLAESVYTTFLVMLDVPDEELDRPWSVHETGLRPGSRVLHLERTRHTDMLQLGEEPGPGELILRVRAVGGREPARIVRLQYDRPRHRITPVQA